MGQKETIKTLREIIFITNKKWVAPYVKSQTQNNTWILSISRFKNQHHKYNLNWVQFMKSFSSSPYVGFYENFLGKHVSTIARTPRPQCNLMEMQRNFPGFFFFSLLLLFVFNFKFWKKNTWQYHILTELGNATP